MQAIADKTTLVSGHTWLELRDLIDEQVQRTHPQVYAIEEVHFPPFHLRSFVFTQQRLQAQ